MLSVCCKGEVVWVSPFAAETSKVLLRGFEGVAIQKTVLVTYTDPT
jgi:hypothetical protein